MANELDLTFLTPEEISHLRGVLERSKKLEENLKQKKNGEREVTSDDVIRSRWQRAHGSQAESYVPAQDAVIAALKGDETVMEPLATETIVDEFETYPQHTHYKRISDSSSMESIDMSKLTPKVQVISHSDSENTLLQLAITAPKTDNHSLQISTPRNSVYERGQTRLNSLSTPRLGRNSRDVSRRSVNYTPVRNSFSVDVKKTEESKLRKDDESIEERDRVASLLSEGSESPLSHLQRHDLRSTRSRSSMYAEDFVGEIELALTYFPPDAVKQKTFPSKGTRFPQNKQLDVLTRKTYVILAGSKVPVDKLTKSGSRRDKDGELHLIVRGATDLRLPSAVRSKAKTYVKCYLLPDRYHGSKMKTEVVKGTDNPRYDHRFVFRGFSHAEFNDRSIELVIGGITATNGRHLVIGGIRLSNGKQIGKYASVKDSNEEEIKFWTSVFDNPSTEISAIIPLRSKIKLTYK